MDNYLIDRKVLGQFVDELIKKKSLPVNTLEELEELRESAIKSLDDQISQNLFGQFTDQQDAEFNKLLDDDASEEDFTDFFKKYNINTEKIIADTMQTFATDFLEGGTHA